jgi:hypothetical protein
MPKPLVVLSVGLYASSFILPVFSADLDIGCCGSHASTPVLGLFAFTLAPVAGAALGGLPLLACWACWTANPLFWLGLVLLRSGRRAGAARAGAGALTMGILMLLPHGVGWRWGARALVTSPG